MSRVNIGFFNPGIPAWAVKIKTWLNESLPKKRYLRILMAHVGHHRFCHGVLTQWKVGDANFQ
jgi:hypothetical protein